MKATELIEKLAEMIRTHGDLMVLRGAPDGLVYPGLDAVYVENGAGCKIAVLR